MSGRRKSINPSRFNGRRNDSKSDQNRRSSDSDYLGTLQVLNPNGDSVTGRSPVRLFASSSNDNSEDSGADADDTTVQVAGVENGGITDTQRKRRGSDKVQRDGQSSIATNGAYTPASPNDGQMPGPSRKRHRLSENSSREDSRQSSTSSKQTQTPNRSRRSSEKSVDVDYAPPEPPKKKPRRRRTPGEAVADEINRARHSTNLLLPKATFARVVREVMQRTRLPGARIALEALVALHESAEAYLVQLFEDATDCTNHRGRVTLELKDINLVRKLRGPNDIGNIQVWINRI